MDTSFWINYKPGIKVDHTLKKYFGKYLYKLVVYAPAGRLIDSRGPLEQALADREAATKNINYGGFWGFAARLDKELKEADLDFISKLRDVRLDRAMGLKLRVEEPRIQIYAANEDQLRELVNLHFNWYHRKYVESISGPADDAAEQILNSGAIIRKTDVGYRYKVVLRDGRYDIATKQSVLQYLTNLGPGQVCISRSNFDMLQRDNSYIWNTCFLINDLDILSFVHLICPGMVSNCHELVVLPHK